MAPPPIPRQVQQALQPRDKQPNQSLELRRDALMTPLHPVDQHSFGHRTGQGRKDFNWVPLKQPEQSLPIEINISCLAEPSTTCCSPSLRSRNYQFGGVSMKLNTAPFGSDGPTVSVHSLDCMGICSTSMARKHQSVLV